MPSKHTPNYNLSQWEAEDKVLRTDFNADNARIDAAIKAVDQKAERKADQTALEEACAAWPYVRVAEYTSRSAASRLNVDVSAVDFTRYHKIELFFEMPGAGVPVTLHVNGAGCDGSLYYSYRYVGASGSGSGSSLPYLADLGSGGFGMVLFFQPCAGRSVTCVNFKMGDPYHSYMISGGATWDKVKTFNFLGSTTLPVGTKITIFGLKK